MRCENKQLSNFTTKQLIQINDRQSKPYWVRVENKTNKLKIEMKTILSLRCTKKWYSMKKILYQAAYSIYWWRDEKLPCVEMHEL